MNALSLLYLRSGNRKRGERTVTEITAFVLTGGKSTRMGRDKALLLLNDGKTLLEYVIAVCASVAPEVKLVGASERYTRFAWAAEFVDDQYEGCGPLGGIHAALQNATHDLNLIVAVDMPNLRPELFQFLERKASASDALVTVPVVDGREQPLCAVYRKGFAAVAQEGLRTGKYKIGALFDSATTLFVDEQELLQHGFSAELFANTNTPEEWAQLNDGK